MLGLVGGNGSNDDFVDPPSEFVVAAASLNRFTHADHSQPSAKHDSPTPRLSPSLHIPKSGPGEASAELELTPEEDVMPTVHTRGFVKVVYNVIKSLNAWQRRAVREIDFGDLLFLDIKETLLRLGHWLFTNYNPGKRVLNLENKNVIHIMTEYVADLLGFLIGRTPMMKRRKRELWPMLVEWREVLEKHDGNISAKDVCDAMIGERDGGEWFKRHFSMIVATTLIECSRNGVVNQRFLDMLDDVFDIVDLNWVRWGTRVGPRNYPALKDWTSKMVKTRQFEEIRTAGFGTGELLPPLRPVVNRHSPQPTRAVQSDDAVRVHQVVHEFQVEMPDAQITGPLPLNQPVVYLLMWARHSTVVCLGGYRWPNFKPRPVLTQYIYSTCNGEGQSPAMSVLEFVKVVEEATWVEDIERAIQRREALKDMSSFSLGLTPADAGVEWCGINATTRLCWPEFASGDGSANAVPLEGTAIYEASLLIRIQEQSETAVRDIRVEMWSIIVKTFLMESIQGVGAVAGEEVAPPEILHFEVTPLRPDSGFLP
nr:uncharacterized protein LOC109155364 [Ipomoea batatas]